MTHNALLAKGSPWTTIFPPPPGSPAHDDPSLATYAIMVIRTAPMLQISIHINRHRLSTGNAKNKLGDGLDHRWS